MWVELPALIMLFPGWVLTCCSFTELCHFVAVAHPLVQEFTFPPELSVNMFRDPELRKLAQALPYILVHDRVASTLSTYLGAYKSWKAWALQHNASVLPADSVMFALYVVSLIQEARSMSAVNSAVYRVSYVHKKSGHPEVSEYPVVKQLLDAAKRILARPPTHMKPLSIDQVWSLLTRLEGGTITDLQLAAHLALGFFSFLRWDDLHHLSVESLNFGVSHVAIFLRRHKNDQFHEGSWVLIARSSSPPSFPVEYHLVFGNMSCPGCAIITSLLISLKRRTSFLVSSILQKIFSCLTIFCFWVSFIFTLGNTRMVYLLFKVL